MDELRDRLTDLASEMPELALVPSGVARRTRRRVALNAGLALALAAAILVGVVATIRTFEVDRSVPLNNPSPDLGVWQGARGDIVTVPIDPPRFPMLAFKPTGPTSGTTLEGPRHAFPLQWSPDGRRLLYSRRPDGLFVADAGGSSTLLSHDAGYACWSPDGSRIAFVHWHHHIQDLDVMASDGTHVRTLVAGVRGEGIGSSAWSPDGTRIAFEHWRKGTQELWTVSVDGTSIKPFPKIEGASEYDLTAGAWSPDGTRIAFAAWYGTASGIYVADADGSNVTRVSKLYGRSVAWSPDGSRIAFIAAYPPHGHDILFMANPDGSAVRRLQAGFLKDSPLAWVP